MQQPLITLLLPSLVAIGGAEVVQLELARQFLKLGYRVDIVLADGGGDWNASIPAGARTIELGVPRLRSALLPLIAYVRRESPNGVIAAMWPLTFIAPLAVKLSCRRSSVLIVEHNTLSRQYAPWSLAHRIALRSTLALALRMADARGGVSRGVADDTASLAGISPDKVGTLYNPVRIRPAPAQDELDRAEGFWPHPRGTRILTVGSMKNQKNHAMLLQAFHHMNDPDICLMLLGQGKLEPELRRMREDLGLTDRLVFAGFQNDPTPFYMTADLFVLSSNYEGFGNVIVEALACGLPVVSTDCPFGPAEILDNGRYGHLTPVGDMKALAQAMQEALCVPVDHQVQKQRAASFSPECAAKAYLDLLFPAKGQF